MDRQEIEVLKCIVCSEFPPSEIFQCRHGHGICNSCVQNLTNCPQCNILYDARKIRNFAVEKVFANIPTECKYKKFGCKINVTLNKISEHEKNCGFRKFDDDKKAKTVEKSEQSDTVAKPLDGQSSKTTQPKIAPQNATLATASVRPVLPTNIYISTPDSGVSLISVPKINCCCFCGNMWIPNQGIYWISPDYHLCLTCGRKFISAQNWYDNDNIPLD